MYIFFDLLNEFHHILFLFILYETIFSSIIFIKHKFKILILQF